MCDADSMPSKRPRASGASDTAVVEKATKTNGALEREHVERPPIVPLDLAWVKGVKINSASVKRRAAEIPTRRTVKKDWQAAWLLRGAPRRAKLRPPKFRPCLARTLSRAPLPSPQP